jgi:uncharacterized membrane protein
MLVLLFCIYQKSSLSSPNLIFIQLVLFIAMGNYFKVIQPNYFIGIKTPWTLENKEVWKLTHILKVGKPLSLGGYTVLGSFDCDKSILFISLPVRFAVITVKSLLFILI